MLALSHKLEVYVPSDFNGGEVDGDEVIASVATILSERFGGATATAGQGFWVSETQGLVDEDVTIVYAYATEPSTRPGWRPRPTPGRPSGTRNRSL